MTEEQKESILNQIEEHRYIIDDLLEEIGYHEREILNLQTLIDDDSSVKEPQPEL